MTAAGPELLTVKLSLIVAPTDPLPKSTAAGLALSVPEGVAAEFVEAEFVEVVELPLALVMPVQPVRIDTDNKRVTSRKKIKTLEKRHACRWLEKR